LAAVALYNTITGGGRRGGHREVKFKCSNCGEVVSFTSKELRKLMQEKMQNYDPNMGPPPMGPMGPMGMGMDLVYDMKCPNCGQVGTLRQAIECPNCGAVYVPESPSDPMRPPEIKCPNCGMPYWKAVRDKLKK